MSLFIGSDEPDALYLGTDEVDAVYLGADQVWPPAGGTSSEVFTYAGTGDGVTTGLIYALGTNRAAASFEEPTDGHGGLNVHQNKAENTSVSFIEVTDRTTSSYYQSHAGTPSSGSPDAAITWNLGPRRTFVPASFAIRTRDFTGAGTANAHPNAFVLEGSNDNSAWTTLSTVTSSGFTTLNQWANFSASGSTPFQYIRLRQTGQSTNSYNQFIFAEIEFWGTLYTDAEPHGDSHPWNYRFNKQDGLLSYGGTTLTVSGSAAGSAANLKDGSKSTSWASGNSLNSWARADAGSGNTITVRQYTLRPRHDALGQFPRGWKIQGSNDASAWTDMHTVTLNSESGTVGQQVAKTTVFEIPTADIAPFRYVRILNTELNYLNQNYMAFSEIEFYGDHSAA